MERKIATIQPDESTLLASREGELPGMRLTRIALLTLITLFSTSFLFGQDKPKIDIFAGYSYLHGLSSGLGGISGAEGAVSWNFKNHLAADFDVSGYHQSAIGASGNSYFFLAGPRVNFGPVFIHGLVGGAHSGWSVSGFSASKNSLGAAFGGGFQWKIVKNISFRTSADYMLTNYVGSIQNNARVSVGFVFAFR